VSFRGSARRRGTATEPRPSRDAPSSGKVTRIVAQEHNPNRVSVYLDGEFAFGIGLEAAASARLDTGQSLSSERVNELKVADEIGRATEAALRLLASRPRSVREISDRLRRKGFEQVTIERAIERLEGWNYVDDAEFARYWVENRTMHKPRGRRLLEQELRTKGVDREVVKEAIAEADVDEESAALELARAKLPSYRHDDPQAARRKLVGFLQRRGYSYDVIKPVLESLYENSEDEDTFEDG
jgi:regulatory protein